MTDIELRGIQTKFKCATLNKLGFPYTYPNRVTFAPKRVFGVNLVNLRIDQGVQQVKAFIDMVGTNQKAGTTLIILLRHLQLEAGVGYHLLEHLAPKLSYLTQTCWMHCLREFCGKEDVQIYM